MFEQFFTDYGTDVLGGALFIGAAWIFAILFTKLVNYVLGARLKLDPTEVKLLARVVSISILILAGIVVLEELGVEIASLIAALGITGFAIAIGLRTTLTNLFTGFMIIVLKPYKVGDYIDGERVEGVVESISLYHTVVVTDDGTFVAVPNGPMWSRSVQNLSMVRPRRVEIELSLKRGKAFSDIKPVIENTLAVEALAAFPPTITVTDVTEKALKIEVGFWCAADQTWSLRGEMTERLDQSLRAANIDVIKIGPPVKKRAVSKKKPAAPPPSDDET